MQMPQNLSGFGRAAAGPQTAVDRAAIPQQGGERDMQEAPAAEQQLYTQFVTSALTLLHDKDLLPRTMKAMNTRDPQQGLADVTAAVVTKAAAAAKKAGVPVPFEIILHGTAEIFDNAAEMAAEGGIVDLEQDPQAVSGAFIRALDLSRAQLQEMGLIDQAEAQAMLEEAQAVDKSGKLPPGMEAVGADMAPGTPAPPESGGAPTGAPAPKSPMGFGRAG